MNSEILWGSHDFLARLMELSLNNVNFPSVWKKAIVVPIYKGGDRSAVTQFRPIKLNRCCLKAIGTSCSSVFEASLG